MLTNDLEGIVGKIIKKDEIKEKVLTYGFELKKALLNDETHVGGFSKFEYERSKEEDKPKLLLHILREEGFGAHLLINSIPYQNAYNFSTMGFVSEELVLAAIDGYMGAFQPQPKHF